MRVTRVAWKKDSIEVHWQEKSGMDPEKWNGMGIRSQEAPQPDLEKARQALRLTLGKVLGLPESWLTAATVEAVKIIYSEKDDARMASVKIRRAIPEKVGDADVCIQTPAVVCEHFGAAFLALEEAAGAYARGDRLQSLLMPEKDPGQAEKDELFEKAKAAIRETRRASTAVLQRRLRISLAVAGELMDRLERDGIVGPPKSNGEPRDILEQPEAPRSPAEAAGDRGAGAPAEAAGKKKRGSKAA